MTFRTEFQMLILVPLPINQLMFSCVTLWFCNHSHNITRNYDVFVSCSEIIIYVIVKHLQHVGIIWACSLPGVYLLSFSVPGRTEKIAGLWFARGVQSPSLNYAKCDHLTSLKSKKIFLPTMVSNIQPSSDKISSEPSGAADPQPMILWP